MQGFSTPYSTWTILDTRRVVSLSYGVSAASSTSHTKSSMFSCPSCFQKSSISFSCLVFRVSFMYHHVTHFILHSYRRHRRTYIHSYISWDVVHSTLGHCSFRFLFLSVSTTSIYICLPFISPLLYSARISMSLFHLHPPSLHATRNCSYKAIVQFYRLFCLPS